MAYGRIDEIDLISLVALPMFAGVVLGVWSLNLNTFNFGFGDTLFSLGSTGISIAMLGSLAAIAALVVQGQLDSGDFEDEEWYVIAGSLSVLPVYKFVPVVRDFIDSVPIVAFAVWVLISVAAVYISYTG